MKRTVIVSPKDVPVTPPNFVNIRNTFGLDAIMGVSEYSCIYDTRVVDLHPSKGKLQNALALKYLIIN